MLGKGEDKICWKTGSTTEFEVRLYYQALVPSIGSFPWKYMAGQGFSSCCILLLVSFFGKSSHSEQLETTEYNIGELVLYVQGRWGISGPLVPSLCFGQRIMDYGF